MRINEQGNAGRGTWSSSLALRTSQMLTFTSGFSLTPGSGKHVRLSGARSAVVSQVWSVGF